MRAANVFQLEIANLIAGKRTLMMKLGFTLLLGLPFVLVAMPPKVQVMGLVFLVLFTSFFGAAVGVVRRRSEGLIGRLRLLPLPSWSIWIDLWLSGALVDLWQIGAVLALYVLIHGRSLTLTGLIVLTGLWALVVLLLNLLGMGIGLAMKNNPEVHLVAALGTGFMGFISGLLPVPARLDPLVAALLPWNPLAHLARLLGELRRVNGPGSGQKEALCGLFLILVLGAFLWRGIDWREISAMLNLKSPGNGQSTGKDKGRGE